MNDRESIAKELEEDLASLLGLDAGAPIDRKRRLEAMGLDSLLAMDLLTALETRHGKLPENVLRDYPTIHQLADYLHQRK